MTRSRASNAGLREGDIIRTVDGQRILTLADFSRVLELTPKEGKVPIVVRRNGRTFLTTLILSGEWRRNRDPSWRESLHVAGPNGGFWGAKLNAAERSNLGLSIDSMAVRVTHIFGDHARDAGLKNGDIVVSFDGLQRDMSIQQLHAHLQLNKNYGDTIALAVERDGKKVALTMILPMKSM